MRIIAYQTHLNKGKLVIEESTGEGHSGTNPEALLAFLLEPYENSIKVCWDLDATVAPLLRLLGKENCKKLHASKKLHIAPHNIFYIPGKVFSVKHIPTKVTCWLYGIDQYFPNDKAPATAKEVSWLGMYLLEELAKMGLCPTKLTSPIAVYEQCIMGNFHVPTVKDMPREAAEYALRCSGKLWTEAYQLGYWPECYDYDIINSFPSVAQQMLDFRYGTWVYNKDYFPGDSVYQYCKCQVSITADISPIIYTDNGDSSTPTGIWSTYLTQREIELIESYDLGRVEIEDGWAWISEKVVKPLEVPLEKILSYRSKGKLQDTIAKRVGTGIYGKMGEERENELGPYFNPCWFAEISSQARIEVAKFIYDNKLEPNLIHTSVDGLLADRLVDVPITWRVETVPALVFSSGLVYMLDKKPHGLNLGDILGMVRETPSQGYYEHQIMRTVSLADAIECDSFEDLGLVKPMVSSLDFYRVDHDRDFSRLPRTGQQLLKNKYKSKARRLNKDKE